MKKNTKTSPGRRASQSPELAKFNQLAEQISLERELIHEWIGYIEERPDRHFEQLESIHADCISRSIETVLLLDSAFPDARFSTAERAKLGQVLAELTLDIASIGTYPDIERLCRKYNGESIFEELEVMEDQLEANAADDHPNHVPAQVMPHKADPCQLLARMEQASDEMFQGISPVLLAGSELFDMAATACRIKDLTGLIHLLLEIERTGAAPIMPLSAVKLKQYNLTLGELLEEIRAERTKLAFGFEFDMCLEFGCAATPQQAEAMLAAEVAEFEEELAVLKADLDTMHDFEGIQAWLASYVPEEDFMLEQSANVPVQGAGWKQ